MHDPKQVHFDYPFRLNVNGHAAVVDQDSDEDIINCCIAILKTPLGFRLELPDFGVDDLVFEEGEISADELRSALEMWEERAIVTVTEDPVTLDQLVRRVGITVEPQND